ncbi:MAG: glycosyltransferase family 2 protein, partial [Candidatus Aminicenantes bacterium]
MPEVKKIAVVLLNWNGIAFLEQFLGTVVKYSAQAEIYLVDNCSDDNSAVYTRKHFPSVKVITLHKNHGFAKGYNESLKNISADYYILLNTDIEVTENWLSPMIALMETDKQIACCQPKVKSYHQKHMFEHAGAAGGFMDKYGYAFCRGRMFNTTEEDIGQYDDQKELFWATGASLCVRADLFHKVGRFDENFFAHMEEIDLCWRLK